MQKFIVAILLATLCCFPLFAQDEKDNYIGIKGGVSIPQLSDNNENELAKDFKSRVAPNFGVFFELGVTEKFSIQPEINYAGQGGKRVGIQPVTQPIPGLPPLPDGNFYYGDFKNTAELNFLEIPVLAKYKFGKKDKPRFYVNGGAYYGRLLSAKTKTSGSSTLYLDADGQIPVLLPPAGTPLPPIPFDAETDIKNDLNENVFGLTGGGGVEFPVGKNYLLVDARISRGLNTIQKDPIRNGDSKTGNLIISFGYAFNLD